MTDPDFAFAVVAVLIAWGFGYVSGRIHQTMINDDRNEDEE